MVVGLRSQEILIEQGFHIRYMAVQGQDLVVGPENSFDFVVVLSG